MPALCQYRQNFVQTTRLVFQRYTCHFGNACGKSVFNQDLHCFFRFFNDAAQNAEIYGLCNGACLQIDVVVCQDLRQVSQSPYCIFYEYRYLFYYHGVPPFLRPASGRLPESIT